MGKRIHALREVSRIACLAFAALAVLSPQARGQSYDCAAGPSRASTRVECDCGDGCWVFLFKGGLQEPASTTGGCLRTSGREALFQPVSGTFTDVPIQTAVATLTAGLGLPIPVSILGDAQRIVTLSYKDRPLQLVLLDLEREAGVTLEGPWLPRLSDGQRFSFGAQGRAAKLAMLIYAVRGRPLKIPDDKAEKRVRLNLVDVTIEQAAQALLRALQ